MRRGTQIVDTDKEREAAECVLALCRFWLGKFGSLPSLGVVTKHLTMLTGDAQSDVSQREREVLDGLIENLSNKEIAARLHISERTVKFHVSNLLKKFGAEGRTGIVLACVNPQMAQISQMQKTGGLAPAHGRPPGAPLR